IRFLCSQLRQLAFTTRQTTANLSQRLRPRQLTKQHRYKLIPASKSSRMPLAVMLSNRSLKIFPRKKLEQLTKNTAKSCGIHQGLASFGCLVYSTKHLQDRQPFFGLTHPLFSKPNLDRSAAEEGRASATSYQPRLGWCWSKNNCLASTTPSARNKVAS